MATGYRLQQRKNKLNYIIREIDRTNKEKEKEKKKKEKENEEKKINILKNPLKILPIKTDKTKIEVPYLMDKIGLKHPFSIGVYGMTSSGKSVLVCNILTNKYMYYKYFDKIYLFSPTANSDDTFKCLKLPPERMISENILGVAENIIKRQKEEIEKKGILKTDKILFLFEDLTSNKKLMSSSAFLEMITASRHNNTSIICVCHKYNSLVRVARLNMHSHFIFPTTNSEIDIIREEHQTPLQSKNDFYKMIETAFTSTADDPKPFLFINCKVPFDKKFRKNLETVI